MHSVRDTVLISGIIYSKLKNPVIKDDRVLELFLDLPGSYPRQHISDLAPTSVDPNLKLKPKGPGTAACQPLNLGGFNVHCLRTLLAVLDFKSNPLAFI